MATSSTCTSTRPPQTYVTHDVGFACLRGALMGVLACSGLCRCLCFYSPLVSANIAVFSSACQPLPECIGAFDGGVFARPYRCTRLTRPNGLCIHPNRAQCTSSTGMCRRR